MSTATSIEWTDTTWNPVRGCALVSPGCTNCYAMRQAHRFSGKGKPYAGLTRLTGHGPVWTGRARLVPEMLDQPLRWRAPRRVFVNSMSDLFHEELTNEEIAAVFGVMAASPQHTFQVLTKRAERMRSWFEWVQEDAIVDDPVPAAVACGIHAANQCADVDYLGLPDTWPLPNVWLGVSVEDQQRADERIPLLIKTPAAVRFVSAEPLLGPVDLAAHLYERRWDTDALLGGQADVRIPRVDWVIVGGESGPGARDFHVEWARSLVKQCASAGVSCFVKQLGARPYASDRFDMTPEQFAELDANGWDEHHGLVRLRLRDRKGGDWSEFSDELRVRQWPEARP